MGSFWGLSAAGREAEGFPREYANWTYQQFKDWLARQNEAYNKGNWASDWALDYNLARAGGGVGSPEEIRRWGREVMPGVDEYLANQQARLERIREGYGGVPSATQTMGQVYDVVHDLAGSVQRAREEADREAIAAAQRAFEREDAASGTIVGDLVDRYAALQRDVNADYGDMRRRAADTYGGLRDSAEETYDTAFTDLEYLKPGSQFAQARAARSFAPAVAATADRLRRAGITGPQAVSAMQRVEAARSRAMDDAAAEGTEKYVQARTDLGLSRQAARERLGLGELDTELGLHGRQSDLARDLAREQGELYRGEVKRHAETGSAIDRERANRLLQNIDTTYDRMLDWYDARDRAALMDRALRQQDWQTAADLAREEGAAEREGIGLRRDQFGAGMGYRTTDLAERHGGAAGVENYGQRQMDYAVRSGNQALGFGDTASQNYRTAYGYEAPKAGWGVRLLGGMAGQALGLIPGVGPTLSGAFNTVAAPAIQATSAPGGPYYTTSGTASGGWGAPPAGGYGSYGYYGATPPFIPPQQSTAHAIGGAQNPFSAVYTPLFRRRSAEQQ